MSEKDKGVPPGDDLRGLQSGDQWKERAREMREQGKSPATPPQSPQTSSTPPEEPRRRTS